MIYSTQNTRNFFINLLIISFVITAVMLIIQVCIRDRFDIATFILLSGNYALGGLLNVRSQLRRPRRGRGERLRIRREGYKSGAISVLHEYLMIEWNETLEAFKDNPDAMEANLRFLKMKLDRANKIEDIKEYGHFYIKHVTETQEQEYIILFDQRYTEEE